MLSLKRAETKPASPSCPVISLTLYTQAEVRKILILKVYNGSHCYFKSPTFPKSSCSAKLERYRCLKEKNYPILSFHFLAAFSNRFSEQYSISNISQKKYDSSQTPEAALTGCLWMLLLLEGSWAVGPRWLTQHEEVSVKPQLLL